MPPHLLGTDGTMTELSAHLHMHMDTHTRCTNTDKHVNAKQTQKSYDACLYG